MPHQLRGIGPTTRKRDAEIVDPATGKALPEGVTYSQLGSHWSIPASSSPSPAAVASSRPIIRVAEKGKLCTAVGAIPKRCK
jgi:hypothetical protein